MNNLKEIQEATNKILGKAFQSKLELKGVNWGDLGCVDVLECRSVYGDTSIMVCIEECSPDSNLGTFVYKELHEIYPDISFDIRTEW